MLSVLLLPLENVLGRHENEELHAGGIQTTPLEINNISNQRLYF